MKSHSPSPQPWLPLLAFFLFFLGPDMLYTSEIMRALLLPPPSPLHAPLHSLVRQRTYLLSPFLGFSSLPFFLY